MPLRKLICIWNYYKERDIIRGLPSSEVRMPCHKYGPFHIISIPTSKKGKKGKCRLVTIPAEAEMLQSAQFLQILWEQRNGSTHEAARGAGREGFSVPQPSVRSRERGSSECRVRRGQQSSVCVRALLGAWLGREWSFISAPLAGRIAY